MDCVAAQCGCWTEREHIQIDLQSEDLRYERAEIISPADADNIKEQLPGGVIASQHQQDENPGVAEQARESPDVPKNPERRSTLAETVSSVDDFRMAIQHSKTAAWKHRLQRTVGSLAVGLLFGISGVGVYNLLDAPFNELGLLMASTSATVMMLAILPTDHRAINFLSSCVCMALLLLSVWWSLQCLEYMHRYSRRYCNAEERLVTFLASDGTFDLSFDRMSEENASVATEIDTACAYPLSNGLMQMLKAALVAGVTARLTYRKCNERYRALLDSVWQSIALIFLILALVECPVTIVLWAQSLTDFAVGLIRFLRVLHSMALGIFFFSKKLRVKAWQFLALQGEGYGVAAGMAALQGNANQEDVLAVAQKRFRYIDWSDIHMEEMKESPVAEQDQRLAEKAKFASMGEVDAFLSHSWRDSTTLKWEQLSQWCNDFEKQHGRSPKLWVDKYCVDQIDPTLDLLCLPVYLAGCQRLLILCGQTWTQRLWCLCEVNTFITLGRPVSDATLVLLTSDSDEHVEVKESLATMDIYAAECRNEKIKTTIHTIVEASNADIGFNEKGRKFFKELLEETENSERSSSSLLTQVKSLRNLSSS